VIIDRYLAVSQKHTGIAIYEYVYEVVLVYLRLTIGSVTVNAVFCGSGECSVIPGLRDVTMKFGLLCVSSSSLASMQVLT